MAQTGKGYGRHMDTMCKLEDRIASDTGLSEQAVRQLMREAFLLEGTETPVGGRDAFRGGCPTARWNSLWGVTRAAPACHQPFINRVTIGSGHG
jgi:hypothetical protein